MVLVAFLYSPAKKNMHKDQYSEAEVDIHFRLLYLRLKFLNERVMKSFHSRFVLNSRLVATAITLFGIFCSASVLSAEDGELGIESTGSISVSLKIDQGVQITDLEDWDLTVSRDNTVTDYRFTKDFCIRGTIGSRIAVTAWTNNIAGNRFSLISDDNESMPFLLEFNPEIDSGQFEEISPTNGSNIYTIKSYNDCSTGNNSEIRIVFDKEDIMSATSLEFTGDLFLTVELL